MELVAQVDSDNPVEGDLRLVKGTLVFTSDLPTEVAQRLRVRFRFFLGDWFLDQREGIPWFQAVLVKNPSGGTIRAIFTKVITETPGVLALDSLDFIMDAGTRTLDLNFTARLEDGSTFRSSSFGPFLVEF